MPSQLPPTHFISQSSEKNPGSDDEEFLEENISGSQVNVKSSHKSLSLRKKILLLFSSEPLVINTNVLGDDFVDQTFKLHWLHRQVKLSVHCPKFPFLQTSLDLISSSLSACRSVWAAGLFGGGLCSFYTWMCVKS